MFPFYLVILIFSIFKFSKEENELTVKILLSQCEDTIVRNTIVELESYHGIEYENKINPNLCETIKLDLEMAVLMQVSYTK